MPIVNRIAAFHDDMKDWRHDIHAHPELAYEEARTAGRVAALLREFGVDEVAEGIGKTGVVGVLRNGDGPRIGLRADMDALPILERTGLPYRSKHDGVMHACGHDGHTAMLLGASRYLAETRNFSGAVVLIFQPEEGFAGARAMMEDGLFDRFPVDAIYGVHNMPGLPAGAIAVSPGPVMAAADSFKATIQGVGGHGAMPHLATDPVVAAASAVGALQSLVSREVDPTKTLVVSVTRIHGGDACNVIPDSVELGGTVRYFDPEVGQMARRRLATLLESVAAAHGAALAEFSYDRGYPPTRNHEAETAFARNVAAEVGGGEAAAQRPTMGSEDFSFFLEAKPGAYAFVGNGDGDGPGCIGVHNPQYDFNDAILPVGASFLARLAETALPRGA